NSWLRAGIAKLYRDVCGNVNLKRFSQANSVAVKRIVVPEMAGRHGIVNGPAQMRFKDVADGERFDGDVFLAFIGIHRSSAADGTVEILNVGSRSFERSAVRFSNADIIHIQRFKTGGIGVDDQAKFANSGLGLDSHAKC